MKFRNVFLKKVWGCENEEKASVKQSAIQRKKIKKARRFLNEQYPNIKIKDQRTLKVAKVKKKIVQAKFRAQNLRFFIKIRENTALTTHPSDEKGSELARAFSGRFCHKRKGRCVIFPLFQPTILTSKARETRVFAK